MTFVNHIYEKSMMWNIIHIQNIIIILKFGRIHHDTVKDVWINKFKYVVS